jgi:hypothetical protein
VNDALFVSFWDVCLENLPDGRFEKRTISAEAATNMIRAAASAGSVVWVSGEDLLAPYHQKAYRRHEELCEVLRSEHGWPVRLEDFLSFADDEPRLATVKPLVLAEVGSNARLLIVGCYYKFVERTDSKNDPETLFAIARNTLAFHLIEKFDGDAQSNLCERTE